MSTFTTVNRDTKEEYILIEDDSETECSLQDVTIVQQDQRNPIENTATKFNATESSNQSPCSCKTCGLFFTTLAHLSNHMKIHQYKPDQRLNRTGDVPVFASNQVKIQERSFTCKVCGRSFNRLSGRTNHMRIHGFKEGRVLSRKDRSKLSKVVEQAHLRQQALSSIELDPLNIQTDSTSNCERTDSIAKSDYKCHKCKDNFSNEETLNIHMINCTESNKDYTVFEDQPIFLKIAKENQRSLLKHACSECEKKFNTKMQLHDHYLSHIKQAYQCELCPKAYAKKADFEWHQLTKHRAVCLSDDAESGEYVATNESTTLIGYQCSECSKTFPTRQGCVHHRQMHRPFECRLCSETFAEKRMLKQHKRIHEVGHPYVCPLCKRSFNQKDLLQEHISNFHVSNWSLDYTGRFKCSLCSINCRGKYEFSLHIVKHSENLAAGKKPNQKTTVFRHECDECGKKLSTKESLYHHRLSHSKGFHCDVCSEVYETEQELHMHLSAIHQNSSLFECTECEKTFSIKEELDAHESWHKSINKYNCLKCSKKFDTRKGFVNHQRVHNDHCRFCNRSFCHEKNLKRHEQKHAKDRPYVCPLCKQVFVKQVSLSTHLKDCHASACPKDAKGNFKCILCEEYCKNTHSFCLHMVKHSENLSFIALDNVI